MKRLAKAVLRRLPRSIQRQIRDRFEDLRRRRPAPHAGIPEIGLAAAQVYPQGVNFDDCLRDAVAAQFRDLVFDKQTPVASIGSCFADEFAAYMRHGRFNYVATESHVFPASANWGRVFTIPCFRQIVIYSGSDDFPIVVEQSQYGWFDPLREADDAFFPTRDQAEAAIRDHRAASRRAFAEARILILTLGQNEAWFDRRTGLAWARRPPHDVLEKGGRDRFEVRALSFEENVEWLADALAHLRELNSEIALVLTVSPVGSYATFSGADAVTSSFAAKSILRAVADRITGSVPRVWYFPSFEMTLGYNPHTLRADNRHVKNSTVDRIFRLLDRAVIRD